MAKLIIVPQADWDVVKKYLGGNAIVLMPESALAAFSQEKADKLKSIASDGYMEYDFGGEPDVVIDIIHDANSYAAGLILGEADDDEDVPVEALIPEYRKGRVRSSHYTRWAYPMVVEDIKTNGECYGMTVEEIKGFTTRQNDFLDNMAEAMVDYMWNKGQDEYTALNHVIERDMKGLLAKAREAAAEEEE